MKETNMRIQLGVKRGLPFEIEVDGEKILAYEGETVAGALIASGKRVFRKTEKRKVLRGMYCGIGQCQEYCEECIAG